MTSANRRRQPTDAATRPGVAALLAVPALLLAASAAAPATRPGWTTTSLAADDCAPAKATELWTSQVCPGAGGWSLVVLDEDARVSVTVVRPDGAEHALKFWEVVTRHFCSVGSQAEWLVDQRHGHAGPRALVIPVHAWEDPQRPQQVTKYRVVVRLAPAPVCVVDRIAGKNTAQAAREAAQASAERPCLKPLP